MNSENYRLRSALRRLLKTFAADAADYPEMTVLRSWETNSGAIAEASEALGITRSDPATANARLAYDESLNAASVDAGSIAWPVEALAQPGEH